MANNGITIKTLDKLVEIDEKIEKLYQQKEKIIKELIKRHGTSEKVVFCEGLEKPWCRLTLTDNSNPFSPDRTVVYRPASFRQYESRIEYLKNEPKPKE